MPDVRVYLASWLPMLFLLTVGYLLLGAGTPARPTLGRWGFWFSVFWLAAIYIVSTAFLRVDEFPPTPALVITVGIYLVLGLLYRHQSPRTAEPHGAVAAAARLPLRWLLVVFITGLATSAGISAGIGVAKWLAVVPFLMMLLLGAGLFLWLVLWRGLIRKPG